MSTAPFMDEPYPGLRSFRRDETHIFFGREGTINDMIERLAAHRFLAVTGTSGSGKSSLVRTGLLDALDRGLLSAAGADWRVADFRPGRRPLGEVAKALIEETGVPNSEHEDLRIEAMLARGPLGLVEWLKTTELSPKTNILLLADQFEEIFRFRGGPDADEIDAFVALLLASAKQRERPVYVVITMRSDFLGDCSQFNGLAEAINDGQYLTPRLTREQCRRAIEGPAAVYGGHVEPALVNRLLNDMGTNADQLPLVQHVLMRLWRIAAARADGKPVVLTLADYEKLGGIGQGPTDNAAGHITNALSAHADEILMTLSPGQQRLASVLFRALVESQGGGRDVRRPIALSDAAAVAGVAASDLVPVVDAFRAPGCNLLTPPPNVPLTPETVVDISHESLIRQWGTLRGWLRKEFDAARTYRRLEDSARLWKSHEAGLLTMPYLGVALDWRKNEVPNAAWASRYGDAYPLAMDFLDRSQKAETERIAAEEQARRRAVRRNRVIASVMAVLFVIASGFAYYGLQAASEARRNANEARRNAEEARRNADAAERNAKTAEDNASEAKQNANEAEKARADALAQSKSALIGQSVYLAELSRRKFEEKNFLGSLLYAVEAMPDQRHGVERPPVQEAEGMLAQGYHQLASLQSLAGSAAGLKAMVMVPSGKRVATIADDGVVRIWDAATAGSVAQLVGHVGPITDIDVSKDGKTYVTSGEDGTIRIWDADTGNSIGQIASDRPVGVVDITRDGQQIVSGHADGMIRFWDRRGAPLRSFKAHSGPVKSLVQSPDGTQIVTIGLADNKAYVWNTETGRMLKDISDSGGSIEQSIVALFTGDGAAIVTLGTYKAVKIWNAKTFAQISAFSSEEFTGSVVASRNGDLIAIGSRYDNKGSFIVNARTGARISTLNYDKMITDLAFTMDGSRLISTSDDHTVRVWRVSDGKQLAQTKLDSDVIGSDVSGIRISPDGSVIAALTARHVYFLDPITLKQAGSVGSERDDLGAKLWIGSGGHRAITVSQSGAVSVWDVNARKRIDTQFPANGKTIVSIAESPDRRSVAVSWDSGRVRLMSTDQFQTKTTIEGTLGQAAGFTPDGRNLVASVGTTEIQVSDGGQGLDPVKADERLFDTRFWQISRSGHWLLTAGIGPEARLWDLTNRKLVSLIVEPDNRFTSKFMFSPDETRLIALAENVRLRMFETATGAEKSVLATDIADAQFSSSGHRMATRSRRGEVKVWDTSNGAQVTGTTHGDSIELSPNGSRLLVSTNRRHEIVDTATARPIGALATNEDRRIYPRLSNDGTHLIYLDISKGTVTIWQAATGTNVTLAGTWRGLYVNPETNPDASRIVVSEPNGVAQLFDGRTGARLAVLDDNASVNDTRMIFSENGEYVLHQRKDRRLNLWDAKNGKLIATLLTPAADVRVPFAFSGDSKFAMAGDGANSLLVWDTKSGAPAVGPKAHPARITSLVASRDGSHVLAIAEDGTAASWNLRTLVQEGAVKASTKFSNFLISDDGKRVAVFAPDTLTGLFDVETGHAGRLFPGRFTGSNAINRDGTQIATLDRDQDVQTWRLADGQPGSTLKTDKHAIGVSYAPDGTRALVIYGDGPPRIWDMTTGKQIGTLDKAGNGARLWLSADGSRIVALVKQRILLWRTSDAALLADIDGGDEYQTIVFSPDGKSFATFSASKMSQFALEDGKRLLGVTLATDTFRSRFTYNDGELIGLVSDRDGTSIGGSDTAAVWPMPWTSQDYVDRIKALLPRCMTRQERQEVHLVPLPPDWCIDMGKWPYDGPKWKQWLKDKSTGKDVAPPDDN